MSAVRTELRPDGIALLTIDQPESKVNVLSESLWADLEEAIDAIAGRSEVHGLVIASAKPGVFIAGADLKLLANAPAPNDPAVRVFIEQGLRVLAKLEAVPFPTCAAIDGAALGGGLEVALACDYRFAGTHPKVQLGLPEVKLGLIPGWGGTQRLPRVIHLSIAIEMIGSGDPVSATAASARRLVTGEPRGDVVAESAQWLLGLAPDDWKTIRRRKQGVIPHATGTLVMAPLGSPGAFGEATRVVSEGATLPLYEAIPLETEAFLRLAGSAESKRLIAEFFASRRRT